MNIININTRKPINEIDYALKTKNDLEITSAMNAVNMVAGGIISQLIAQPKWLGRLEKAGIAVLKFATGGIMEEDYVLMFQYNPNKITEQRLVNYDVKKNIFNGEFTTEFSNIEPIKLKLSLMVDAFYDYFYEDSVQALINGALQGVMTLGSIGSTGLDLVTYAQKIADIKLADRNVINAMDNLRKLVSIGETKYYKYSDGKFTVQNTSSGDCLRITTPPVICKLFWEGYRDIKFVISSMEIQPTMFDTKSLKPQRCTVDIELLEYNNDLGDKLRNLDGDTLVNIFKGKE